MILHSDGRIEGTPAEIAEYKERMIKVVKQIRPDMTEEGLKEKLGETTVRTLPFITTHITSSESEDMRQQREYGRVYTDNDWKGALKRLDDTIYRATGQ